MDGARLTTYEGIPEGFLDATPNRLHEVLEGSALLHLRGRREPALFTSVLLHGNEHTGLEAVQRLLRKYRDRELPRSLSVFVGNVAAARFGVRRLEQQPDYNRVWPGGEHTDCPEGVLMAQVVDAMTARGVFASVDIHNNTGLNPHYACVNRIDNRFFHLATLFSRVVVYFTSPRGVQSQAFAHLCPAVTVECGKSGDTHSAAHALEYLDACLHLAEFAEHPPREQDMALFHTVATVKIPNEVSFGFGEQDTDLLFERDLDHLNFRELAAGTRLGRVRPGSTVRLNAWNEQREDVADRYFHVQDGELRLSRPVMPSMLTLDRRVIRQDCLCYLMERYDVPRPPPIPEPR